MKKVISLALLASMILTGASTVVAADEGKTTNPEPVHASSKSWVNPTWVIDLAKSHPRVSAATGVAAALVAMYNYCSWFRKLIGAEEEERAPRLMDPAKTRAY